MWRWFNWMTVAALCCAVGTVAQATPAKTQRQAASELLSQAQRYAEQGLYSRAEPLYTRALALEQAALGPHHPGVATPLAQLARLYQLQGKYARAEPLYTRALALREAVADKDPASVAASLNSLATLYHLQGKYSQAEPLYARALALYEKTPGVDSLFIAFTLTNLALVAQDQGRYEQAEQLYQRALAGYESALGPNHPKVSDALIQLGQLYDNLGQYGRTEPLYARAAVLFEEALSKSPSETADLLIHLSGRVDPLYERALAISERTALGKTRPHIATSLDDLSFLYNQEIFESFEQLILGALAFYEQARGKNHPDVALVLTHLATAYEDIGWYSQAEPLMQRALGIYEATLGKTHPQVAASRSHLGLLYQQLRQYGRAEPLQVSALAVWEAALGKQHPDLATPLTELARTYQLQGLYARAAPLYKRALAVREAALGPHHPDVSTALQLLAELYQERGETARAEPLLLRALAIQEAALGPRHPGTAYLLNQLARLRLSQQRLTEALPLFARAFEISEELLRHEALGFSEAHLTGFLQFLRADEEHLYALLREHPEDERVRRLALATVLLRKGRSAEEAASTSRAISRSLSPQDRETFEQLRGLRAQLAKLSFSGAGLLSPVQYQQRLEELATQGDVLETDLASRSAPLRALTSLPSPEEIVGRVAATLPSDGALIEFIAITDRPLVPRRTGAQKPRQPDPLRYLALVLFPNGLSRAVDLGPAEPIDRAASSFRDALAHRDATIQDSARALYAAAFQPVQPLLGDAHRLFLAPDGQLGLIPFGALHDGHGWLMDTFDFTYLTSGADVLPRPGDLGGSRSTIVFADPDFSMPHAKEAERKWVPLPGTRREAQAIQQMLPEAQLFLGAEANRERLLRLSAPRLLHIATHGFFLGDSAAVPGSRAVGQTENLSGSTATPAPSHPMLRSGLVLANPKAEDSMVTALELAGLDLWGTELVVLSACDTGRGDVKVGQGVYGLRRSLVVAGAETVVMSLWKVNDDTTRLLMEEYYRNLLEGKGRSAALHDAMRALRETHPHPHSWAPFIVQGRDGPLRSPP